MGSNAVNAQTILALNRLIQRKLEKWGALRGERKCRGSQHKCLSCMMIFRCFEY